MAARELVGSTGTWRALQLREALDQVDRRLQDPWMSDESLRSLDGRSDADSHRGLSEPGLVRTRSAPMVVAGPSIMSSPCSCLVAFPMRTQKSVGP